MVVDGCNMRIDNNKFDSMSQLFQDEIQSSSEEEPKRQSRWKNNGTYDIKPLDPDYFKKYYLKKLKTVSPAPTVGQPYQTKQTCQNIGTPTSVETPKIYVEVLHSNLIKNLPQPATLEKLLKEIPPYILRSRWQKVKMLETLSEECLLNISSFMLGTPQKM